MVHFGRPATHTRITFIEKSRFLFYINGANVSHVLIKRADSKRAEQHMAVDLIRNSAEKVKILFVNPSMGISRYRRGDWLRSYLPLGTLASALMDIDFLRKLAYRRNIGGLDFGADTTCSPFGIDLLQLSLKGNVDAATYLECYLNGHSLRPDMICMTATSAQMGEAEEVAYAAGRLSPEAIRVIGGPHVSVAPESSLQNSDYQVACVGEGVETLSELALSVYAGTAGEFIESIPGITYKDDDGIIHRNEERNYLFQLDEYPFPSRSLELFIRDFDDIPRNKEDIVYVLGGFGCQYNCIFCAQRAIHRGGVRERSAGSIVAEIETLVEKGFRKFAVVQETFLGNRERIGSFCSLIEASALDIEWTVESRVDQVDFPMLHRMKDAGLRFIQIGLESGDQDLLDAIGKRVRLWRARQLIAWLTELRIDTAVYLLVGLPKQGWQSILRSALFFIRHTPYNTKTMHASTSIAIPYYGTKIGEDHSVRIRKDTGGRERGNSRLTRNPEVVVNEKGEFVGENFTQTDDMTSHEILEALIYLGDLCQFLLRIKYDTSLADSDRTQYREYSKKILYMIERRTVRDLIVRAQETLTAEGRYNALQEIISRDNGAEDHFKDVTENAEESPETFRDFIAAVSFDNGFDTMKCLSVPNRVKWMKVCFIVWMNNNRRCNRFCFSPDSELAGGLLNETIQRVDDNRLQNPGNRGVAHSHHGLSREWANYLEALGITFRAGENAIVIMTRDVC